MPTRLAAPLLICLLAGCAGDWATASGKVTLDSAPLQDGVVTFHPDADGATAYGRVTDGAYTVSTGQKDGLKTGKYKVAISASTIPEPGTTQQAKLLTPKKYATKETTDLEAEVKSGANTFNFDMKSK